MLNTQALQDGIQDLLDDMQTRETNSNDEFASRLAILLTDFVRSAEVQPGISLQAGAYTGATTGTGTIE